MIFGVLIQYIQDNTEELLDNGVFCMENRKNCKICQKKMESEELKSHLYSESCRKILSNKLKHLRSKVQERSNKFTKICDANEKLVKEINDITKKISSVHGKIEETVIKMKSLKSSRENVESELLEQLKIDIVHKEKQKQRLVEDLEYSAIKFYEDNETAYNENEESPMIF